MDSLKGNLEVWNY